MSDLITQLKLIAEYKSFKAIISGDEIEVKIKYSTKKKDRSRDAMLFISENLLEKLEKSTIKGKPVGDNSIAAPHVLGRKVSCWGHDEIDRELFDVLKGLVDDDGNDLAAEVKVRDGSFCFVLGSGVVVT
jgi:5'-3' exonuclease